MPRLFQTHFFSIQWWSFISWAKCQASWCSFLLWHDLVYSYWYWLHLNCFLFAGSTLRTSTSPFLWRIVLACAIPIISYCSLVIFSGLLNKVFTSIKKCLRLLSTSSCVAYSHSSKVPIFQHCNSCKRLAATIINDPLHPLHTCLANALSTSNNREDQRFRRGPWNTRIRFPLQ